MALGFLLLCFSNTCWRVLVYVDVRWPQIATGLVGNPAQTHVCSVNKLHRGIYRPYPFSLLDGLKGYAICSGASFVGTDKGVGMTEDVYPEYLA